MGRERGNPKIKKEQPNPEMEQAPSGQTEENKCPDCGSENTLEIAYQSVIQRFVCSVCGKMHSVATEDKFGKTKKLRV